MHLHWCTYLTNCYVYILVLVSFIELSIQSDRLLDDYEIHVMHKPTECAIVSDIGDNVAIHYTGKFESGKIFDSTIKTQRPPTKLVLGTGQAIEGWEKGLLRMCIGERRELVIPAHMAYGDKGHHPIIPGGATLRFEVHLVGLEKANSHWYLVWELSKFLILPAIIACVFMIMNFRMKYDNKDNKKRVRKRKRETND